MINMEFLLKVMAALFATVGIEEYIKNFFKPKNKVWYAVLMLPLSVGCYVAVELLPLWVIGSILTVGGVQLSYQTLVQGYKAIIESTTNKLKGSDVNVKESGEGQNV